jgi:hypothetical protein
MPADYRPQLLSNWFRIRAELPFVLAAHRALNCEYVTLHFAEHFPLVWRQPLPSSSAMFGEAWALNLFWRGLHRISNGLVENLTQ